MCARAALEQALGLKVLLKALGLKVLLKAAVARSDFDFDLTSLR